MTTSVNNQWLCIRCGYVHEGDCAPIFCPICQASAADFVPYTDENKLKYAHVLADKE